MEAHAAVVETVGTLRADQGYRHTQNLRNARLYGNVDTLGLSAFTFNRSQSGNNDNRVTMNVIQSCIDTCGAKIASKRPKPMFLTEEGDFDAQTKAKKLNKFVDGLFYDTGIYPKTSLCFKDAGVLGDGMFKVYSQHGRIVGERVFPDEITVDDNDGIYGAPRNFYQQKAIPRSELAAAYPKYKDVIAGLDAMKSEDGLLVSEHADQVMVVEAWRLPITGEERGKVKVIEAGRHIIAIKGATFVDEEWNRTRFPFAKLPFNPKLLGYWSQGIAEILTGKQIEINKTLRNIQTAQYFCSSPIWMVEKGSKVLPGHINNDIGNILNFTGMPPELRVFQSTHPEIYQHLMWLIQSSYEEIGVSQLSANSQNPLGANASGKALSTFNDFETERFAQIGQQWEQFHMDIATLFIEEAKDLYKNKNVNLAVKADNGAFIETIKFSEIDLTESKYVMKVWPVSAFSSTPAAKMQEVTEAVNSQLIDPETAMDLLDFPDLQNKLSLRQSKKKLIEKICERMVEKGEYMPAEPFMDLTYAMDYAQNYYNLSKMHNVPEERLELLRRFMSQCEMILGAAQPGQEDLSAEVPAEDILASEGMDETGLPMEEQFDPEMIDPAMEMDSAMIDPTMVDPALDPNAQF